MAACGDFIRSMLRTAPVCCAVRDSVGDSLHAGRVAQYATLVAHLVPGRWSRPQWPHAAVVSSKGAFAVPGMDRRGFLGVLGVGGAVLMSGGVAEAGPDFGRRAATRPLFIGTYTDGSGAGKGIGIGAWDPAAGTVTANSVVTVSNPSFLALAPSQRFLYSVDEQAGGRVTALSVSSGGLKVLNSQSAKGDGPTHLCVTPDGKHVLAANYDSGSVVVLPVKADGSLGAAT